MPSEIDEFLQKTSAKCAWGQCGRDATQRIGFKLYALGFPKIDRYSLTYWASVSVCDECKPEVKIEHFLLPEGKERIASAMLAMGRQIPDFTTGELKFQDLDDPVT